MRSDPEIKTAPLDLAGIILAGGSSSRMGQDKALLDYGNGPAVQSLIGQLNPLCAEVLVVSSRHHAGQFGNVRIIPDEQQGMGPLMGILSGLEAASNELCFVMGCDVPKVNIESIKRLYSDVLKADIAALSLKEGQIEPLYAVYRRSVRIQARTLLDAGKKRVQALFQSCRTVTVNLPESDWLVNVNTPADFQQYMDKQLSSI